MREEVYKVLTVGGAGGDITLYGCQHKGKSYYVLRINEAFWYDMLDESEGQGINNLLQQTSDHVEGWELGIKLLERYSWRRLHPVYLNPAYKERILASYLEKSAELSWRWKKLIEEN